MSCPSDWVERMIVGVTNSFANVRKDFKWYVGVLRGVGVFRNKELWDKYKNLIKSVCTEEEWNKILEEVNKSTKD